MGKFKRGVLFLCIGLLASCSENLNYELGKAAERGDTEKVKSLIAKGANVDVLENCMTPLMRAVERGHLETMKALLIAGADPEKKNDCSGATAKSYIQKVYDPQYNENMWDSKVLRLLVSATSSKRAGYKPTEKELQRAINGISKPTLTTQQPNKQPQQIDFDLHKACIEGDKKEVIRLLNAGADLDSKDEGDLTPLLVAGAFKHPAIMELLIDRGAQVNARSERGDTALLYAAEFNFINVVKKLIAKGVDVNQKDEYGFTPLRTALGPKNMMIVNLLKKAGAKE